jgi:hypothetical protein
MGRNINEGERTKGQFGSLFKSTLYSVNECPCHHGPVTSEGSFTGSCLFFLKPGPEQTPNFVCPRSTQKKVVGYLLALVISSKPQMEQRLADFCQQHIFQTLTTERVNFKLVNK